MALEEMLCDVWGNDGAMLLFQMEEIQCQFIADVTHCIMHHYGPTVLILQYCIV